jgi:hypothetical protein
LAFANSLEEGVEGKNARWIYRLKRFVFQGLVGPLILSLSLSKTLRLKIDDDGLLDEKISIRMNVRFRSYLANRSLSV